MNNELELCYADHGNRSRVILKLGYEDIGMISRQILTKAGA